MNEPTFKSHPLECMIQKKRIQRAFFKSKSTAKYVKLPLVFYRAQLLLWLFFLFRFKHVVSSTLHLTQDRNQKHTKRAE